jgi:hypothetical protein
MKSLLETAMMLSRSTLFEVMAADYLSITKSILTLFLQIVKTFEQQEPRRKGATCCKSAIVSRSQGNVRARSRPEHNQNLTG